MPTPELFSAVTMKEYNMEEYINRLISAQILHYVVVQFGLLAIERALNMTLRNAKLVFSNAPLTLKH